MTASSLLSRPEALTGPSREVDAEIALATGWARGTMPNGEQYWRNPAMQICPQPPRYTESLDAAVALVADDLYWLIAKGVTRPDEPMYGAQILAGTDVIAEAEHNANPAIALVIAILRARESA
jgi:hypothetical protein